MSVARRARARPAQWLRASGSRSPRLDAELLLADGARRRPRGALPRAGARAHGATRAALRRLPRAAPRGREPVAYIRGRRAFRTIELEVTPARAHPAARDRDAGRRGAGGARRGADAAGAPRTSRWPSTWAPARAASRWRWPPRTRSCASWPPTSTAAPLEVARRNAARLGLERPRRHSCVSDLLDDLPAARASTSSCRNPPYIPGRRVRALEPNVRDYEPRLALLRRRRRARRLPPPRSRPPPLACGPAACWPSRSGQGRPSTCGRCSRRPARFELARERADLGGIPRVVFARRLGARRREADDVRNEKARAVVLSSRPLGEADRIAAPVHARAGPRRRRGQGRAQDDVALGRPPGALQRLRPGALPGPLAATR